VVCLCLFAQASETVGTLTPHRYILMWCKIGRWTGCLSGLVDARQGGSLRTFSKPEQLL
jgi:hypothetical protein